MPELPEVEDAVRRLRAVVTGRTIVRIRALHRTIEARVPMRTRRALR
nr:DNA-formamidopyrimidine glycosylase [Gemmatimonadaceae bacterium]